MHTVRDPTNTVGKPVGSTLTNSDTALPVDVKRRAEATTQLVFAVHAAHRPRLAAIRQQVDQDIRQALAAGYGGDAAVVADAVIALSDGPALRMLYAPRERERLLTVLDRALDALLSEQSAEPTAP